MLTLTHATFATTEQLFRYKNSDFQLEKFPGYTNDQWGIKAHNRPWIDENGMFGRNQSVLEVGGAYSRLPEYLNSKYGVEAWIGDDFGIADGDDLWSRWGDPRELPTKYPQVNYLFKRMGDFDDDFRSAYFDRIFSVSTLEHIPLEHRLNVFKDMNRCLKPGGRQLHTIDIGTRWRKLLSSGVFELVPVARHLNIGWKSEIRSWVDIIRESGVQISIDIPSPLSLFNRKILVESPDVVYRFYPPVNEPKIYNPAASLLIIIDDI